MQAQRPGGDVLYAPMIDARRMEVFTAVYDQALGALLPPQAMILEPGAFELFIAQKTVIFFGDGAPKWRELLGEPTNTLFPSYQISAEHMIGLRPKPLRIRTFKMWHISPRTTLKPSTTPVKSNIR